MADRQDCDGMSRRNFFAQSCSQAAWLTGALALAGSQGVSSAGEDRKVYGSAFLDSLFEAGSELRDAIKLRYKCQVVENQCPRPEMWKIIFMYYFLYAPGSETAYELQSNLYTWKFVYPHLSRRNASGEVQDLRTLPGETSLFLSVPDNHKDRRVGARSRAPSMFPTLDQEIDGIQDLWKREQVSQATVTGQVLSIEIGRGAIARELRGWNVHGELPPGKYRIWTTRVMLDGSSYKVDFVLPEESARYFVPSRLTQIATEAFFEHPGLFQAFFWDIEIQRENRSDWQRVRKWKLVESDGKPEDNTWGMRAVKFKGRPAIEVSNDGTRTYTKKGETIELA